MEFKSRKTKIKKRIKIKLKSNSTKSNDVVKMYLNQHRLSMFGFLIIVLVINSSFIYCHEDESTDDVPNPPKDLNIDVVSGKIAHLDWQPPDNGKVTGYRLTVSPLSELDETINQQFNISSNVEFPYTIRDLVPGGHYEVQLYSILNGKLSTEFLTTNFTTKPNVPGRFIVWYRNETTLLVLLQPPYPSGIFDHYKVKIEPEDAFQSLIQVKKDQDPPVPAQASFYGLVPGRAYNLSTWTVSGGVESSSSEAQYRTVPLAPTDLQLNNQTLTSNSFELTWSPPKSFAEYDRFQFSLSLHSPPKVINKESERIVSFTDLANPGKTYEVVAKTVSQNVVSWPVTKNITTRPLPVVNLVSYLTKQNEIQLKWLPANDSIQDSYLVKYHELEAFNSDGTIQVTKENKITLENLLDGRNYSISVQSVSNGSPSLETITYQTTKPGTPVIETLESINPLHMNSTWKNEESSSVSPPNVSSKDKTAYKLTWKSDVTSRQDEFKIVYMRKDQPITSRVERKTKQNWIILEDLWPGSTYSINVSAISYGLSSPEPHTSTFHQTLSPKPPESFQIVKFSNSSILLSWSAPIDSLVDSYMIRFKPMGSTLWQEQVVVNNNNITTTEIHDLISGELYNFKINTISNKVESLELRELEQTLYPNAIESVSQLIASNNITFKILKPLGRVDYYIVVYNTVKEPTQQNSKQIFPNAKSHLGDIVTIVIDGLISGELYSFRFYAVSHNLRSEGISLQVRTQPLINSVINIVTDEQETKTLGIKYTPTPRRGNVIFDRYRFQLVNDPSIPAQEKLHNDTSRLVLFDNLVPGRLYNLSIWTVSGGVYSMPIQREVRLYPGHVKNLQAIRITDTEITLSWESPFGDHDAYEITYLDPQQPNKLISNITHTEKISYKKLRPHQNYSFEVLTVSGYSNGGSMLRSAPITQTFTTLESTPGKVAYFKPIQVKPNEITFQWSMPSSEQNGILTGYRITYFIKNSSTDTANKSLNGHNNLLEIQGSNPTLNYQLFEANSNQGTIFNLQSGQSYSFLIQAHTKIGPGSKGAHWEETMPVWSAPKPANNVFPTEVSHSSNSIVIRFKKNFFSNIYGPIKYYTLIVAENHDDHLNSQQANNLQLDLPNWAEIQSKSVWPPYQATDLFNPFEQLTTIDFVVGNENCDEYYSVNRAILSNPSLYANPLENSNLPSRYCNGYLKPGTSYRFKVRAFTTLEKFTDTEYSYPMQTDPDNTTVFVGVFLPMASIVLVILILMIYKQRRISLFYSNKANSSSSNSNKSLNGKSMTAYSSGGTLNGTLNGNSALFNSKFKKQKFSKMPHSLNSILNPHNLPHSLQANQTSIQINGSSLKTADDMYIDSEPIPTSRPIKIKDFSAHFRVMDKDSSFRFSEEFELLRNVGKESPSTAADLPVNRPKNRFTNILPYDHSRVKLLPSDDDDYTGEGSDYINANYLPGFNSPREFLVTQGPLPGTRDDFWRMIFEQHSVAIVMLTRCIEKGREKCSQYYPINTQPVFYGDIQVTLLNESQYQNWTISEFKLTRGDVNRTIKHFFFTSWPDFGVPEPVSLLTRFVRTFRENVPPDSNHPVTVHCSAGVGRSGTFIALDRILQHIKYKDYVDIYGIVYQMRKERTAMVQNEQQYICIHECLLNILEGKEDLFIEPQINVNQGYEDDDEGIIAESGI